MSTSDQQGPLTRKQLREIRQTGSTPVVGAEQTEDAVPAAAVPPVPPVPPLPVAEEPAPVEPVAPAPVVPAPVVPQAPVDEDVDSGAAPLTRRQAREQERVKTASVPVQDEEAVEPQSDIPQPAEELVSAVPDFPSSPAPSDDDDDIDDEQVDIIPVSAAAAVDTTGEVPLEAAEGVDVSAGTTLSDETPVAAEDDAVAAVSALGIEVADEPDADETSDVLQGGREPDAVDAADDERPTVNAEFGLGVAEAPAAPAFAPSFDELLTVGDSTGSHTAANALIFNPPAGDGALDGPVASTGEILVTGSYELPKGIGSQGHAHGTTDGKDIDSVLIDGELPPASSPTPIAASAAVSTIKPAGEVIRPPAPEKGNKLMLTLAIVAGGLALALGVVLIIAFTSNVFNN